MFLFAAHAPKAVALFLVGSEGAGRFYCDSCLADTRGQSVARAVYLPVQKTLLTIFG